MHSYLLIFGVICILIFGMKQDIIYCPTRTPHWKTLALWVEGIQDVLEVLGLGKSIVRAWVPGWVSAFMHGYMGGLVGMHGTPSTRCTPRNPYRGRGRSCSRGNKCLRPPKLPVAIAGSWESRKMIQTEKGGVQDFFEMQSEGPQTPQWH